MSVRDDVRLAVEMDRGLLDRFVRRRLSHMDDLHSMGYSDASKYREWLAHGSEYHNDWVWEDTITTSHTTIMGVPVVWIDRFAFAEPQTFVGLSE